MKKLISVLISLVMVLFLFMVPAYAANESVHIGNTILNEGINDIEGGTATLDSQAKTLTLKDVSLSSFIWIENYDEFTIIAEGENSIGQKESKITNTSIIAPIEHLNINIKEGASLSLYNGGECNSIYVYGSLDISGAGKLTSMSEDYPSIWAMKNITFSNQLDAKISSYSNAVQTQKGNIKITNSKITIEAGSVGLFANNYDESADEGISSSVIMDNSNINIKTDYAQGVFCGAGGIVIDNCQLNITTAIDSDNEGYSLYTEGDIEIKGTNTSIKTVDNLGICAGDVLTILGGTIDSSSVNSDALYGYFGVDIRGGKITVHSQEYGAIASFSGKISIDGDNTRVIATSDNKEIATIRNVRNSKDDCGIYLNAYVSAMNTGGGKAFEGNLNNIQKEAITLGSGFKMDDHIVIHTELNQFKENDKGNVSYFVTKDNSLITQIDICKHSWKNPTWQWKNDYSSATLTLSCDNNENHTKVEVGEAQVTRTEATCTEKGKIVYTVTITVDGVKYKESKTVEIPVQSHVSDEGKVTTEPTTEKEGVKTYTCTVCGEVLKTESIAKLPQPEVKEITIRLVGVIDGQKTEPESFNVPTGEKITDEEMNLIVKAFEKETETSLKGYKFKGLFLDDKGKEELKANYVFDQDTTIYLLWEKEVNVTVDTGISSKDEQKPADKPVEKPTNTVKTSDDSNIALYTLLTGLAIAGVGIILLTKKRNNVM